MGKLKDNRRNKGARPREASLKNSHCGSSALPPFCPSQALGGIADSLRLQCPLRIERSLPEKANSDTLDKELVPVEHGRFNSVLFCASWCPFSQNIQPIFDALSSIFPKIRHLTVEESSALPSAFS
ncbi:5'-adenylylsulfate reductase-like 5 isoform X1 [Dendrobium catenatum]|uniref:5'-adenylylsulfate reductase-like 5 isoform X1 n=1 Tax=Dendrobium catenatum TaxID=906689 RepID=UPI0009F2C5B5|nr:5'-adenylylsulfate reductase-like 5 isoform X1 [Dendrobium catenatum]